jgi:lipid II:glycine glycyltransferase (peptidoglycan interpeptide bridge formation enzyme)
MSLRVRPLSRDEHLAYVASLPSASFLQCPSWGDVKKGWAAESIGWESEGRVVGAGLVLFRQIPRVKRYLAYLPEGPTLDWESGDLDAWTEPMLAHLRDRKAFSVKMGPPVVVRRWQASTIKDAMKDPSPAVARLRDLTPDVENGAAVKLTEALRAGGWRQEESGGAGFGDYQPRYVFQLPLEGRGLDDVWSGLNQEWRRNVRKAEKEGVEVTRGGRDDMPAFHALYLETAERDGFTGRPLEYFTRMYDAMTAEDPDRLALYLARHEGTLHAATLVVTVGEHVWYSYGASSSAGQRVRASNAVQWQMVRDAHERGARVYDLRGMSDTLDPEDHLYGLLRFKVGTGGEAVEYVGEWDYALNPVLHKAFETYMKRR